MNEAYVNVNGVPTKIVTCGKWIEADFDVDERKEVILLIPGNPGIVDFYKEFMRTIHENVGLPVWAISHAGHELPNSQTNPLYDVPSLTGNEASYGLDGQIRHKVEFIEKYVPKDVKIHVVGHSIGSYVALKLLAHDSLRDQIAKSYLLFPTIEFMAETPNGKLLVNYVKYVVELVLLLAWIFTFLPTFVQNIILTVYCWVRSVDEEHKETIRHIIDPHVLDKIFFMAFEEMDMVRERDRKTIEDNVDSIKFYYGATDGWAPVDYYRKLKNDVPQADAELCVRNFNHAFVLKQSIPVGRMVANWIANE